MNYSEFVMASPKERYAALMLNVGPKELPPGEFWTDFITGEVFRQCWRQQPDATATVDRIPDKSFPAEGLWPTAPEWMTGVNELIESRDAALTWDAGKTWQALPLDQVQIKTEPTFTIDALQWTHACCLMDLLPAIDFNFVSAALSLMPADRFNATMTAMNHPGTTVADIGGILNMAEPVESGSAPAAEPVESVKPWVSGLGVGL